MSPRQLTLGVQLKERATFESFLTARNVELVAHLHHVAANTPAGSTWIAGPHTAGKSHLLQAVCAAAANEKMARRLRALIVILWPAGLRTGDTLDIAATDLWRSRRTASSNRPPPPDVRVIPPLPLVTTSTGPDSANA